MFGTKIERPDCCECPNQSCGQTDTLDIIKEFRQLYEQKLKQIDCSGGGDALKMKLEVQSQWIEDLTEQTELMAKVVKELETEATERVHMLEEQLQRSAQYANEVMRRYQICDFPFNADNHFQNIGYWEHDVKNLVEFVRRIREESRWSNDGLEFYNVNYSDLFGKNNDKNASRYSVNQQASKNLTDVREEISRDNHEAIIEHLRMELGQLRSLGNPAVLSEQLKMKTRELEILNNSMLDMRTALTEEVAKKHDMISSLKRDIHQLEERCVQSDKQTAFKDDIIKELRKEIKELKKLNTNQNNCTIKNEDMDKLQLNENDKNSLNNALIELGNNILKNNDPEKMFTNTTCINISELQEKERVFQEELCKQQNELCKKQHECDQFKCRVEELEEMLCIAQERAENLQKAVDLYLNSVNVLEASEDKAKIEIEQQKITINNLQEALLNAKHELDEIKEKRQLEVSTGWARWFGGTQKSSKSLHDV